MGKASPPHWSEAAPPTISQRIYEAGFTAVYVTTIRGGPINGLASRLTCTIFSTSTFLFPDL